MILPQLQNLPLNRILNIPCKGCNQMIDYYPQMLSAQPILVHVNPECEWYKYQTPEQLIEYITEKEEV